MNCDTCVTDPACRDCRQCQYCCVCTMQADTVRKTEEIWSKIEEERAWLNSAQYP